MDSNWYNRKRLLLQRAEITERNAARMKEPEAKETMLALAGLYRDLAKQIDELSFLKERARRLS